VDGALEELRMVDQYLAWVSNERGLDRFRVVDVFEALRNVGRCLDCIPHGRRLDTFPMVNALILLQTVPHGRSMPKTDPIWRRSAQVPSGSCLERYLHGQSMSCT
jgi:hypothetical protein